MCVSISLTRDGRFTKNRSSYKLGKILLSKVLHDD